MINNIDFFAKNVFSLALILFYFLPGIFSLTKEAVNANYELHLLALFILFLISIINFLFVNKNRNYVANPKQISAQQPKNLILNFFFFLMLIMFVPQIPNIIDGLGSFRLVSIKEGTIRNINFSVGGTISAIIGLLYITFGVYGVLFIRFRNIAISSLILVFSLMLAAFPSIISETRSLLMFAFLPLLIRLMQSKLSFFKLTIAGFVFIITTLWFTAVRANIELSSALTTILKKVLGDMNFYRGLLDSIHIHNNLVYENQLFVFFSSIIPRFLWEGKPISKVVEAHTILLHGNFSLNSGNVLPGLIGQFITGEGILIGMLSLTLVIVLYYKLQNYVISSALKKEKKLNFKIFALISVLLSVGLLVSGRNLSFFNFAPAIIAFSILPLSIFFSKYRQRIQDKL